MGGTRQFFHFARHADFATFAKPAANPQDADDQFVIATAHVMKEGKKFNQMYSTVDTGELESGSNGEIDGKSFKPTFKFFYPGSKKDALAFANRCKNDKFIVIVSLSDGTTVQIGDEYFPAYLTPNFKSTQTSGRGKGFEFEVMAYQPNLMTYTAVIPVIPAAAPNP